MSYAYIINDENYSKDAIKYAHDRTNYELEYINGMNFTKTQIEWIREHIYFSVRKAYDDGYKKNIYGGKK